MLFYKIIDQRKRIRAYITFFIVCVILVLTLLIIKGVYNPSKYYQAKSNKPKLSEKAFTYLNPEVNKDFKDYYMKKAEENKNKSFELLENFRKTNNSLLVQQQYEKVNLLRQELENQPSKNDIMGSFIKANEMIINVKYLVPFFSEEAQLTNLYKDIKADYTLLVNQIDDLKAKVAQIEADSSLNENSWISLAYIEYSLEDNITNILSQADDCLKKYEDMEKSNKSDQSLDEQCRMLGISSADLEMVKETIEYADIIYNKISSTSSGPVSKNKRELVSDSRIRALENLEGLEVKEQTLASELAGYARQNIEDGKNHENENLLALAYYKYRLAEIFLNIAPEYNDMSLDNNEAFDYSLEQANKDLQTVNSTLDKISFDLKELELDGKSAFDVRVMSDMFYKSWAKSGADFITAANTSVKTDWSKLNKIVKTNINVANEAFKLIRSELLLKYK